MRWFFTQFFDRTIFTSFFFVVSRALQTLFPINNILCVACCDLAVQFVQLFLLFLRRIFSDTFYLLNTWNKQDWIKDILLK